MKKSKLVLSAVGILLIVAVSMSFTTRLGGLIVCSYDVELPLNPGTPGPCTESYPGYRLRSPDDGGTISGFCDDYYAERPNCWESRTMELYE